MATRHARQALIVSTLLPTLRVDGVVFVTSMVHMPRAVAVFRAAGVPVIPAPTRNDVPLSTTWRIAIEDFLGHAFDGRTIVPVQHETSVDLPTANGQVGCLAGSGCVRRLSQLVVC